MSAAAPGAPEKGATVERAPGLMFDPSSLLHQAALPQDILAMTRAAGLQVYTATRAPNRQQDPIAERLIRQRDRVVRDILLEEWSFLTGQSWVAAPTKKVFDAFRRAGSIVMDFSGQKLDGVVARTL